ncbi:MAG: molecular chaperone GrpE [Rhodothermales bacterium]|jgi:molecular chaperone GrpE
MDENTENETPDIEATEEEVIQVEADLVEDEDVAEDSAEDLAADLRKAQELVLRKAAEFDNFRKRSQRDLGEVRVATQLSTLNEFFPVMDNFRLAMLAVETSDDIATLKQGMAMIMTGLENCFTNLGLTVVDSVGQTFDPNVHHASKTEPSDEPEGTILKQFRPCYMLGERLVRPATVVVSSGPEVADSADEDAPGDESE